MTVAELATAVGISREYLQLIKAGKKPGGFTVELAGKLAKVLECSIGDLLSANEKKIVRVTGHIMAGAKIKLLEESEQRSIDVTNIPNSSQILEIYEAPDNSNAPMIFKGYLYYLGRKETARCEDFSDSLYAVKIRNGDIAIRRLRKGETPNRYKLLSAHDISEDTEIEWYKRVIAITPPL